MGFNIKNICCIGAGYVGGPSMAVIAKYNPEIQINVVDINPERIDAWNNKDLDKLPINEVGLSNIIKKYRGINLHFKKNIEEYISKADLIFLCVNTPTKIKGFGAGQASDLRWIETSVRQIAKSAKDNTIIVQKSTIPVKTAETIKTLLNSKNTNNDNKKNFFVLSNPEFLSEGTAINDLNSPDRILIGGDDENAISALEKIYLKWLSPEKIIKLSLWSAELSKLTANAFLAQRVSSINAISSLCEATGANVLEVSNAIGTDSRIGDKYLNPGPGFGGSCFKKDLLNLIYIYKFYGLNEFAEYWESILKLNTLHQIRISELIVKKLFGTVSGKKIIILGFAFKKNTNDTRESPAINICKHLLEEGAYLQIYDPKVSSKQISIDLAREESLPNYSEEGSWSFTKDIKNAAVDSDAIIILTEWKEFAEIDWQNIAPLMRNPSWLFDTRNIANIKAAKNAGLRTWQIGMSF